MNIKITPEHFKILGRSYERDGVFQLPFSGSSIEFTFTGSSLKGHFISNASAWTPDFYCYLAVFIDNMDIPAKRIVLDTDDQVYDIYESDTIRPVHIKIVKTSEVAFAHFGIKELITDTDQLPVPAEYLSRKIEFIGDSITCGYGIDGILDVDHFTTGNENSLKAYSTRTARALNADFHLVSWSGIGTVSAYVPPEVNEPLNDWIMQMLYPYTDSDVENKEKVPQADWKRWDTSKFVPDLIVINIGTNDASYTRMIPERVDIYRKAYYDFLKTVRTMNPDSVILCTLGVMNQELCEPLEGIVAKFKQEQQDEKIHYFYQTMQLLEDGYAVDYHPTDITHQKLAKSLTEEIKRIMNW